MTNHCSVFPLECLSDWSDATLREIWSLLAFASSRLLFLRFDHFFSVHLALLYEYVSGCRKDKHILAIRRATIVFETKDANR